MVDDLEFGASFTGSVCVSVSNYAQLIHCSKRPSSLHQGTFNYKLNQQHGCKLLKHISFQETVKATIIKKDYQIHETVSQFHINSPKMFLAKIRQAYTPEIRVLFMR